MKKLTSVAIILLLSTTIFAQEKEKVRVKEVGLTFYNLDGFGITYRVGTEKALWRFNSGYSSGNEVYIGDNVNSNFSIGANVGREWRKELASKLDFRYGIDLQYSFGINSSENANTPDTYERKSTTHFGGLNLVLGFNYEISSSLFVGAELLPFAGFNYSENKSSEVIIDQFGIVYTIENESSSYTNRFGIQNSSALISIVYQF